MDSGGGEGGFKHGVIKEGFKKKKRLSRDGKQRLTPATDNMATAPIPAPACGETPGPSNPKSHFSTSEEPKTIILPFSPRRPSSGGRFTHRPPHCPFLRYIIEELLVLFDNVYAINSSSQLSCVKFNTQKVSLPPTCPSISQHKAALLLE